MSDTYVLLWGGVVLFWLLGVFVIAVDIWRTRTGVRIGQWRFKMHWVLTLFVAPIGLFGALVIIEWVLPFKGVGRWIYVMTVLGVGGLQFVLLFISGRRWERETQMSDE